ncbi:MAG: 16S rRNA (cytidine(1402)-2'-O)-methyltransferase [Oscillospiraceae bacterium]|nr:16S rRNA (cytidine(1402)-2'-O)-methyltransferase [Oscillospiraceae bacterium]
MAGKLYLVGTPIGNLGDFSPRGAETLRTVDFIAAEDTRVTIKLLNRFEIKKPLVSYHEHNRTESGEKIAARIENGENCALVTDAGMPAVSDPGAELVKLCAERGTEIVVVPGPSAVTSAAALSGITGGRFAFEGFLSADKRVRAEHLNSLRNEERAMVFYEAPHKIVRTLADMLAVFGAERAVSISRELTKIHEETRRGTLGEALTWYENTAPRGEFALVVAGREKREQTAPDVNAALALAKSLMKNGSSLRDAAKSAAEATGAPRNKIYALLTVGGAE